MTLKELCAKYKTGDFPDKDSTHSYIDVYEEILAPYRHTAKNILEIGLMSGESLRMWTEYFSGNVYGIDCDLQPIGGLADLRPIIAEGKHKIHIADATKPFEAKLLFHGIEFDVIVEDAGHQPEQQIAIYEVYKNYIAEGGIYIIEDIQNLDADRKMFEEHFKDKSVTIFDRREQKGRYDDVLIIIQ